MRINTDICCGSLKTILGNRQCSVTLMNVQNVCAVYMSGWSYCAAKHSAAHAVLTVAVWNKSSAGSCVGVTAGSNTAHHAEPDLHQRRNAARRFHSHVHPEPSTAGHPHATPWVTLVLTNLVILPKPYSAKTLVLSRQIFMKTFFLDYINFHIRRCKCLSMNCLLNVF